MDFPQSVTGRGQNELMRNTTDRLSRKLELVRWLSSIAIFVVPSLFFANYMIRQLIKFPDTPNSNTSWPIAFTLLFENAFFAAALAWFFLFPRIVAFFRDGEWRYW